jgi:D-alanyl-D-alanine carboxypeptidase
MQVNGERCLRRIGVLALVGAFAGVAASCTTTKNPADVAASETTRAAAAPSDADAASGALPAPVDAKLRQIVRQFKTTTRTPGVLVGVWTPNGQFLSVNGVADLATGERLKEPMQFKIASITKSFVATLILQLVGEGEVSLGDRISDWVAGVPNGNQITIRQLLNHTSGLATGILAQPAHQEKVTTGCTVRQLLRIEAKAPPVAAPGTTWSYSNYGYHLLGRVVELATGQQVSSALRQRITEPLGLRRTLLPTTIAGAGLSPPFTHGYGGVGPTQAATAADDATALPVSCNWAAGGMVSTLSDLRIWSQALATGELLKPAVWRQAKRGTISFKFPDDYEGLGRWKYGLGFYESGGFIGGQGSYLGFESTHMYSPARRTTIVVVSTKQTNAITPPPMFQALAMGVFGRDIGFGLTPAQALKPNCFGLGSPPDCAPAP